MVILKKIATPIPLLTGLEGLRFAHFHPFIFMLWGEGFRVDLWTQGFNMGNDAE